MAITSPQTFSLAGKYQGFSPGDFSNAFKTNLDSTLTSPVTPETTPGVANSLFNSADLDVIRGETDPTIRGLMLMEMVKRRTAEEDRKNFPGALKDLYDLQYEARLKARPLEAEELMFRGFMDAVKGAPAKLTAHRDMVAPMNSLLRQTRRSPINYGAVPIQRLF